MKKLSISILAGALVLAGITVRAQDNQAPLAGRNYDEAKEADIAQKAKKRLYPGGRDESDLKVQSQWSNPPRKMAPTAHVETDSSED